MKLEFVLICFCIGFHRNFDWNSCPSGYCLSGLYRSESSMALLSNIEYAWCCKPSGASDSHTTCYDEDVSISFKWNRIGMASCSRSGHYITGLFKSDCNFLHCIKKFRCCKFHSAEAG